MGNILTFDHIDAGYGRVQILHDLSFSGGNRGRLLYGVFLLNSIISSVLIY